MEYYFWLKLIHILSSTLLFGTGIGTAFYMWRVNKSNNVTIIANTAKNVVLADWLFTTPTIIIQPISGLLMMYLKGIPMTTSWLMLSIILYILVGCFWLPVIWIQIQIAKNAQRLLTTTNTLNKQHQKYMKAWYVLGWPAFISVIFIFYLMVFKPNIW